MLRKSIFAVALLGAIAPAFAQRAASKGVLSPSERASADKLAVHEQMHELARDIRFLRAAGASEQRLAQLIAEYDALSASMGGDDPARLHDSAPIQAGVAPSAVSTSGAQLLTAPACSGSPATTVNFAGTPGYIADFGDSLSVFSTSVSGVGTYLWDINLNTFITHPSCADLDIGLMSPAGTIVVITSDNGGVNDNVFNGTVWDDNALNATCVDFTYANNVTATPLNPEGRLSAFRGEDPNGTWLLLVLDDASANVGTVNSWSVDVTALAGAPVETTTTFTNSPNVAIPDAGTIPDVIAVGGLGTFLDKVVLYLEITHTDCSDLDITLTSPLGTVVKVTTDNGGAGLDNTFNGTIFNPSATGLAIPDGTAVVTDNLYRNLVVEVTLSPEGAFDNFLGEDPNGNWTLSVTDDLATDVGTLVRWDLSITTTTAPVLPVPSNFAGTTGAITDDTAAEVFTNFTATVSGVGTYLWDLDLNTARCV